MSTFGYAVVTLSNNLYVPYVLGGFSMGKHTEKYPRANPHPQASGGVSAGTYIGGFCPLTPSPSPGFSSFA